MLEPTVVETRRNETLAERQHRAIKEKNAYERKKEIRRLARNHLMHSRDLNGTREEILNRAIKKASMIYDDVEAVDIKPKEVH